MNISINVVHKTRNMVRRKYFKDRKVFLAYYIHIRNLFFLYRSTCIDRLFSSKEEVQEAVCKHMLLRASNMCYCKLKARHSLTRSNLQKTASDLTHLRCQYSFKFILIVPLYFQVITFYFKSCHVISTTNRCLNSFHLMFPAVHILLRSTCVRHDLEQQEQGT